MSPRSVSIAVALGFVAALPASAGTFIVGFASGVRNEEVVVAIQYEGDGTSVDAMFDLAVDPMSLTATGVQGANGGECEVIPGSNGVRVLAPEYTGQPLDGVATDLCYVTLRIEPFPPTPNLALGEAMPPNCVSDAVTPVPACDSSSGAVTVVSIVSKPEHGSTITFVGEPGDTVATRTITVVNTHPTAPQSLSNCTISQATPDFTLALADPNVDAGGGTRDLALTCTLPPIDTVASATLTCTTSDPALPSLKYGLACTAASEGVAPDDPIESSDGDAGDRFGTSIAVTDLGATEVVVVGAPDAGDGGGQVYVYERVPGQRLDEKSLTRATRPSAILRPWRKSVGDKFGQSVAVSPDGSLIAVGAPEGGNGAVMVYRRPASNWETPQSLAPVAITAPPAQGNVASSGFGASVAFTPDNTLVIGANKSDVGGTIGAGSAHIFSTTPGNVVQIGATMAPGAPQANGGFGSSVAAVSSFVAVGAPGEGGEAGAVYAFQTTGAGAGAGQRSTRASGALGDKWGSAVAAAGNIVVVGAPDADTAAGTDSGLATVLVRGAGTQLTERTTLVPESGTAPQGAGAAVATNGNVVVIGAPLATVNAQPNRGRAFLYELGASQVSQLPSLTIDSLDGAA
ncbi:MAG TPA: hypothetical protein VND91_11650, partial [Candidatus Saccharimonadia bacterium]|nr:hypothetical protein [Candidatus Saccharimonadia bacterium]